MLVMLFVNIGCYRAELVRQSLSPIPQEAQGALYVATNKPIQVGVEGTGKVLKVDVGGYYLIHKNDLKVLIDAASKATK